MITKSDYTNYLKCRSLYFLRRNHKELEAPLTVVEETNIHNGFLIQEYAQQYFDNAYVIDRTNKSDQELYEETLKLIESGTKVICEASFIFEDLFCAVDILKINDDKSIDIYEVKSAKDLNPVYYDDASFQYYVLSKLGYKINRVCLMHPSKTYTFKDELNIKEYFEFIDVDPKTNVEENLKHIRATTCEQKLIACSDCKSCGFKDHCFKNVVKPNVLDLSGKVPKVKMFNEGIISFEDFLNSDYALINKDYIKSAIEQAEFEINDLPMKINKDSVTKFLDSLVYPLYYLDFETVKDMFPFINGTTIAFPRIMQYSLHIQYEKGGEIEHLEYLQESKYDNLEEVADRLIKDLGTSGSILVYSSFENQKIKDLQKLVPSRSKDLELIRHRLVDMADPFKKRDVYTKELKGRYTIKYVLPVLCPEFEKAYASLPLVHNGSQIDSAYEDLIKPNNPEHEFIKNSLLSYCELDTLAEVKIIEKLYEFVGK